MKLVRLLAVGALAASLLATAAGCTPSPSPSPSITAAPTRSPSPTSSASPSPSATATVAPTDGAAATSTPPADAVDLADPATWTISFDGIGPIRLGRPVSETISDLAALPPLVSEPGCPVSSLPMPGALGSLGFALSSADESLVGTAFFSGPADPELAGRTPATAEGIGPGSPESAVQAAYPAATYTEPDSNSTSTYLVTDGDGRYIQFSVLQGTVLIVAVSDSPDRPRTTCA